MTCTVLICNLVVMIVSLIVAIKFLSDKISGKNMEHRKLKTVVAFGLAVYSSVGFAILIEYYCTSYFMISRVFSTTILIFTIFYVMPSTALGVHKMGKERK